MSTPLAAVGAITLFVDDPRQAKAFYERVFDVSLVFEDDDSAAFAFEGTIVNLLALPAAHDLVAPGLVAGREHGSRCQLTIWVEDADEVCANLATRGVTFAPRASPTRTATCGRSRRSSRAGTPRSRLDSRRGRHERLLR
jgi:lactoylglutathione lyase